MSKVGFVDIVLDNTNRIYKTAFKQFAWWKKVQGTKVIVSRIKQGTSYKNVFGSTVTSTLRDDDEVEKFHYVILISMSDMKRLYNKSSDPLQFYDNERKLEIGDLLTFSRKSQEYKWKVTEVQTFGEAEEVLYMYSITGLMEVNSTN